MYNIRYHLASLVAVFLALAIGLLLGTIVVERGALDKQKTTLVDSLRTEFITLRDTNERLESELKNTQAFASAALPVLVADTLNDRNILVLINEGRSDGLNSVTRVLGEAGAHVTVGRLVHKGLGLSDRKVAQPLSPVTRGAPGSAELVDEVSRALAEEWSSTSSVRPVTDALVKGGALRFEGYTPDSVFDGVLLMAAFDEKPDSVLLEVMRECRPRGIQVACAEALTRKTGLVVAGIEAGISGSDDVDRPEGAFSLVWLLSGRAHGRYGVAPGAEGPFPQLTTATVSP